MNHKKETEIDLLEIWNAVWNKKLTVIKYALCAMLAGVVIAYSIPKEYTAKVIIAPETTQPMSGSMGGLAAMMGVDMQAGNAGSGVTEKIYPQIIESTPFLLEFADIKINFEQESITMLDYINAKQKTPWWSYIFGFPSTVKSWFISNDSDTNDVDTQIAIFNLPANYREFVSSLSSKIKIEKNAISGLFDISVQMQDPLIAAIVTDSVVNKLQHYVTQYRTSKVRADLKLDIKMYEEAQHRYYCIEDEHAKISDRNQNLRSKISKIRLSRLKSEKDIASSIYQQLANQVEMSKIELQERTPIATIIEPVSVPAKPSAPNKTVIVMLLTFLGGFVTAVLIVVKYLMKK